MSDTENTSKDSDKDLLSLARDRMKLAISATSDSRNDQLQDLKFAAGSPDNKWQWPDDAYNTRTSPDGKLMARPCLTVNKLPQHIRQVTNDQRQNRPAGKVIPANDEADVEVAEIFEGMVRHIEYISDADVAYDTACENQVEHGEGYWRIVTDYVDEKSFNQDILIKRIRNSFSVYIDPMIQDPCGADADWALITEDILKKEYETLYPDATPISSLLAEAPGDEDRSAWIGEDTIRIAEYFYIENEKATLNLYIDGSTAFDGDDDDKALRKQFKDPVNSRPSERKQVKWCKINGFEVLERRDWPGKYIPVIRVIGNEWEVDGQIYLSGIVRNAKDAQRMYNYWTSQEAEMLALAPKAPFIGYGGQFEGYEDKWKTANTKPWPYLEVNPDVTDGNGGPLPLPQRAQPPMAQQGLIAAKQAASDDIKETTGQYNASLGMESNERSGKAIMARQHEGDVGTYHYVDNLARAVRYSTRQIIDLIPKIYDTQRVARIIGEDGQSKMVHIDPNQTAPVQTITDPNNPMIVIKKIYNPSVGRYDVRVASGPGYATKRQEALDAMSQLVQANPELWKIIGDLLVKNMDWPGSQEIAQRLAKTIPPALMQGNDVNPALQQAQQQIQQLEMELQQAHGMLTNVQNSVEVKEMQIKQQKITIEQFDAETRRIQAMAAAASAAARDKAPMTPEQIQDVVMGTIHAAIVSGDVMGQIQGTPDVQASMIPQQPQQEPQQAPPLDPNKVMAEQSKQQMQAAQHTHEMNMAQMQAEQQQAAQQPQGGENV